MGLKQWSSLWKIVAIKERVLQSLDPRGTHSIGVYARPSLSCEEASTLDSDCSGRKTLLSLSCRFPSFKQIENGKTRTRNSRHWEGNHFYHLKHLVQSFSPDADPELITLQFVMLDPQLFNFHSLFLRYYYQFIKPSRPRFGMQTSCLHGLLSNNYTRSPGQLAAAVSTTLRRFTDLLPWYSGSHVATRKRCLRCRLRFQKNRRVGGNAVGTPDARHALGHKIIGWWEVRVHLQQQRANEAG